jgi:hypothetical protein
VNVTWNMVSYYISQCILHWHLMFSLKVNSITMIRKYIY